MYIVVHILLSLHVSIGYNGWQWFAGGLLCGIGLVGAGSLLTRRILYPNPEVVFQSILPKLRASPEVAQLVGRHLQPGLFRAYSHIGGTVEWVGLPAVIKWKPRECCYIYKH